MEENIQPSNPSCHICGSEILVPEICGKCGRAYCDAHTSKIDTKFCQECMSQVTVIEDTFKRSEEEYDEDKDQVVTHTQECKVIKFSGPDWVWNSRKIRTMTDDELKTVLEYHRGMVYSIEQEITTRKVQAIYKDYGGNSITKIKKTTEVKSKKVAKTKTVTGADLAAAVKKMNLSPEQLKALFGG